MPAATHRKSRALLALFLLVPAPSIGALAALTQCLAEHYQRQADLGQPLPRLRPWFVRENKWRAARYGLDADIIIGDDGSQAPLRTEITSLLETLAPVAESLDCEAELADVARMLQAGTSAERQLHVFERCGGEAAGTQSLIAVVDSLAAEFAGVLN